MGAALRVPFARATGWPGDLAVLRARGFTVVVLTPRADAPDISCCAARMEAGARIALLVGSEGAGVSDAALALADVAARIPMAPDVDSLNVATATGIALHRFDAR
jgi:tRNA G18 (ribose-2'-O)-methylase SpoU